MWVWSWMRVPGVELWVLKSLRWSQRVSTKFQPGLAEKTTQILDDFLMFILHLFLQIILSTQIMTLQNNVYINRHLMKNLTSSYRCLPSTEGGPFTLGVTKLSSQQSQNFSISWSIPIKEYNVITLFTICTVLNELVQETLYGQYQNISRNNSHTSQNGGSIKFVSQDSWNLCTWPLDNVNINIITASSPYSRQVYLAHWHQYTVVGTTELKSALWPHVDLNQSSQQQT